MFLLLKSKFESIQSFYKIKPSSISLYLVPIITNCNKISRTWFEYAEDITQHTGVFVYNNKEPIALGCFVVILVLVFGSGKNFSAGDFEGISSRFEFPKDSGGVFTVGPSPTEMVGEFPLETAHLLFKIAGAGAAGGVLFWNLGWDDLPELRELFPSEISILEELGTLLLDKSPYLRAEFCKEQPKVDFKFLGEFSGILDTRKPAASRRVVKVVQTLLETSRENSISLQELKISVHALKLKEQQQVVTLYNFIVALSRLSNK